MQAEFEHERLTRALSDGMRADAVAKQHRRGKLTARERIERLTDSGSFVEIGALARPEDPGPDGEPIVGDGIVTGTALIDGRPTVVIATDFTAAGGSNGVLGNEKQRRCWEIAATRGIPVVMLFDGGGHRIHEGLDAREFAGGFNIQETLTRLSGWVPIVAAFLGPGYGQATLAAALCDYVVAVRGIATVGMAPPPLVRAATGEDADASALFSADAQAGFGTVDLAVDDEEDALLALRVYLATVPPNSEAELPHEMGLRARPESARAIDDVIPADLRKAYDMYDVLDGLVDEDSLIDLKAGFARNMVTALATIDGHPLGIVANQPMVAAGALDTGAADKAAHLVSLCDAFGLPVLMMIDLPGLAVGADAERSGLARSTGRLSLELGQATVPLITIVARKGYGGGYVVMSGGRTFHPELVLAWPHSESGVMGVESAIELVFRKDVEAAADPSKRRVELAEHFRGRLGAVRGAEGFGYDAIVRPSQTRERLVAVLRTLPRRKLMQPLTPRRRTVNPL